MKPLRLVIATAAFAVHGAASAASLLDDGTLYRANDLTRVQVGVQVLEFLDLDVTQGMSVADALAAHQPSGMRWADGGEVGQLLSAFGMTYTSAPGIASAIGGAGLDQRTRFVSRVGDTYGGFRLSLGWVDDLTTATHHSYTCIAVNQCNGWSYVNNTPSYWPDETGIGVFLVREAIAPVPEPSAAALAIAGLLWVWRATVRRAGTADRARHAPVSRI